MIPAALAPLLSRWGTVAAVCGGLALWGWAERAGRQVAAAEAREARREVAALQQRIRNMEVRRAEEDRAARDADPVGSLRRDWSR